jgi:hypothetical protein
MAPEETEQEPQTGGGVWTPQVESLLEDWRSRVYAAQSAHYRAADLFRLLNYVVGVPAVVFASLVGTALFTGLEKDSPATPWIASVSIAAAILAALQTFLRFAERAANHATAGDWYSALRRDIEQTIHLPADLRGTPKECLDRIRKEMNRVAQDSPELRVRDWQREAKRFAVKEPTTPP